MAEYIVVERHNPVIGLTHGVYRKGESGSVPICLCYNEAQANVVAAALAAYAPVSLTETAALPAPVAAAADQAPETKARKSPPKRKGKNPG